MKPTQEELEILNNQKFLLLKNQLNEKIIRLMSNIERDLHEVIENTPFQFPPEVLIKAGKISKGEQYKGLPYYVLDYPRLFTKEQIFAFRTMLWWGNHFSCTLHLQGELLQKRVDKIISNLSKEHGIYFCVNESPWEYHYNLDNYRMVNELSPDQLKSQFDRNQFIKISLKLPITEWEHFESFTKTTFIRFLELIR